MSTKISSKRLRKEVVDLLKECKGRLPKELRGQIEKVSKLFFDYHRSVNEQREQLANFETRLKTEVDKKLKLEKRLKPLQEELQQTKKQSNRDQASMEATLQQLTAENNNVCGALFYCILTVQHLMHRLGHVPIEADLTETIEEGIGEFVQRMIKQKQVCSQ